jgi:hypothetical protein
MGRAPPPASTLPEAERIGKNTTMDLPPYVRLQNEKTGLYHLHFRRGGKEYSTTGKDVAVLVAWRKEIDAKLDAEGVPKTQVKTKAAKQSSTPGVQWGSQ